MGEGEGAEHADLQTLSDPLRQTHRECVSTHDTLAQRDADVGRISFLLPGFIVWFAN